MPDGHGTHTAGTIAGSIEPLEAAARDRAALNESRGVAYEAKLLVFDFQSSLDAADKEEMAIPDNMYDLYYGQAHSGGARVCANSWGQEGAG